MTPQAPQPNISSAAGKERLLFLLIVLIFALFAVILPGVDYRLTLAAGRLSLPAYEDFFCRTMFQGGLPGAGDLIVVGMVLVLALYLWVAFRPTDRRLMHWRPALGFALFAALVSAVGFVHGTKWAIGRARPNEVVKKHLAYSDWFEFGPHYISEGVYRGSFPSGHTAAALLLILLAYVLAGNPAHSRRTRLWGWVLGVGALSYTLAMAFARSMAMSHWLSDGILGMLIAWALIHAGYFWILRVPEQSLHCRAMSATGELPPLWELRLGFLLLGLISGMACLVLGLRALLLPVSGWYVVLLPLGMLLCFFFGRTAYRLYCKFRRQLQLLKGVQN